MVQSPAYSFQGWQIFEFLKGRKKTAVTLVGSLLGLFIMDSATVAIVSGAIIEMLFALGEYYVKPRD